MDEGDLARVRLQRKHAFAEEGAPEGEAVKPADEAIVVPRLDAVRIAELMQLTEHLGDVGVDPRLGMLRPGGGAGIDNIGERRVDANLVAAPADDPLQPSRRVERRERQNAAQRRRDPVHARVIAMARHRKDADRIRADDDVRRQHATSFEPSNGRPASVARASGYHNRHRGTPVPPAAAGAAGSSSECRRRRTPRAPDEDASGRHHGRGRGR